MSLKHLNEFESFAFANEGAPVLPAGHMEAGQISMANEERFTSANFSEPLTAYTVGWQDPENLDDLIEYIAPRVPVPKRFEYKSGVNFESFLSELDDERAIQANFKRVEYTAVSVNARVKNRGLTYRLDVDEEGGGVLTEELITARLLQRLKRNKLRRAVAALIAVATDTAKTWTSGTPTPQEDIRAAVLASQTSSGVWPNRLLIDPGAWNKMLGAYALGNNAMSYAGYLQTLDGLAAALNVDQARLMKAMYATSKTAKGYILNNKVIAFPALSGISKDDPSAVKNFVYPAGGDGDFRVFRQEVGPKFIDITVEHYDYIAGTSSLGVQSITAS